MVSNLTYEDKYHGYLVLEIIGMLNTFTKDEVADRLNISITALNLFIRNNLATQYILKGGKF
jgi:hypothetical protein